MRQCDNCGKKIADIRGIKDEKNIYDKEYKRKKDKVKNKFKRFFYTPNMPVYYGGGLDFCDKKCYAEWEELFKEKCKDSHKGEKDEN